MTHSAWILIMSKCVNRYISSTCLLKKRTTLLLALAIFVLIICSLKTYAQDANVHPTYPGTSIRDYSKPGAVIEGDMVYPTHPVTNSRDYSKPGKKIDGNKVYPTHPVTNSRDYSKPGAVIEGDMVYPTHPVTNSRDYSKPGYRIESEK